MDYLRKERYDYFLIWGNGMPHEKEMLSAIRNAEFLKIVRIMRHRPKSIPRFVRKVYSYDYAPFEHLRAKTRYLLSSEPSVTLVLVRNQSPRETVRGRGAFRHIECERIKTLKEAIRDRFNPRRNGKRTEEHVVHASDNESQVDRMLRVVGFKEGIASLSKVPNPILSCPYYLPRFKGFTIKRVAMSQLRCRILTGTKQSAQRELLPVEETPHFAFLTGDSLRYERYLAEFLVDWLTCDYSVDRFVALAQHLTYLEGARATSYIIARELGPGRYLILDGVHRASVLRWRGLDSLAIAVIE